MSQPEKDFFKENFELALDTFEQLNLNDILHDSTHLGYTTIAQALHRALRKAEDEDLSVQAKVLWLLERACWVRLSPGKRNEPLDKPAEARGSRSPVSHDFSDSEVAFLAKISESIDNPYLRGRLADLVWSRQSFRDVKFAIAAIHSYMRIPVDSETWFSDGELCWRRATILGFMINNTDSLDKIESCLVSAMNSATVHQGFYGYRLADTLMTGGLASSQSTAVAERLEKLAVSFDAAQKFDSSGRHYRASAKWYQQSGDELKSNDMIVAEANALSKEADSKVASDTPSYLAATRFIEKAIQVYRDVPGPDRERHCVDQKIRELQFLVKDYGRRGQEEFKTFSTPGLDVKEWIERACDSVRGKSTEEALKAFASLHWIDFSKLRESAIEQLSQNAVQGLFPNVYYDHDGRVIDKTYGFDGTTPSEESERAIRAQMNRFEYGFGVELAVQTKILPALDVLTLEHQLSEADFILLAARSPVVPLAREILFGKALAYGYNKDFMTSIHLLTPQIEHMVRSHLQTAGVVTSHFDRESIETEKGLSSLMEFAETRKILGENLAYEIEAIFCDQIGPNLRNKVAHGLLDDQHTVTYGSIYSWWLGLKLVVNSVWGPESSVAVNSE